MTAMRPVPEILSEEGEGKKRKRRAPLNCAECRRLKLRCDRKIPCTNCVKRDCQNICPDRERVGSKRTPSDLQKRVRELEYLITTNGISLPDPDMGSSSGTVVSHKRRSVRHSAGCSMSPPTSPPARDASGSFGPLDASRFSPAVYNQGASPLRAHLPVVTSSAPPQVNHSFERSPVMPIQSPPEQSLGTLVISHSGRSKYLGPSAASEWLHDQEVESPGVSRLPSPDRGGYMLTANEPGFPFGGASNSSTRELVGRLPPEGLAKILIEAYYRYFAWSYDIAPRPAMELLVERIYSDSTSVNPQSLALLFSILAMGALYNLELPPDNSQAHELMHAARTCLVKGDFMTKNTIAGVQTLHIMAHFVLENEKGRNGDSAWPLWGLAMRIVHAMGLHRDGQRWNLLPDAVEERRRVFWECHSAEIFQANCFSRPSSISSAYVDTLKPTDRGYSWQKFELSQISAAVLHQALSVEAVPFSAVTELYGRLCLFELQIPYDLRCRAALLALPSSYVDADTAIANSPEVSKWELTKTFEQYHLALMTSEAIVNLYRPYFIRALQEPGQDPIWSLYGQAFLSVIERSNAIIQITMGLYALYPSIVARHWWNWYHAFNSAVCMATMILLSPQNALVKFAFDSMDQAIVGYTSIVQTRSSPRLVQNLQVLLGLRGKAVDKVNIAPHLSEATTDPGQDGELISVRTRLIERGSKKGSRKATTISGPSPVYHDLLANSSTSDMTKTLSQAVQQFATGDVPGDVATAPVVESADHFLQEFWDPMVQRDEQGEMSFWNTTSSIGS